MIFSDFSNFLNGENIIFFVIYGLIVLVAVIFFLIVVRFFVKIIISTFKKIFYRKEIIKDQGSDLRVVVNELEESKEERRKMEIQKLATAGTVPTEGLKGRSKPEKSEKQGYDEKEQKDIAEGLSKLKSDSSAGEGTLQSKMPSRTDEQEDISKKGIKIPTSRKEVVGGGFIRGSVVGDKIEDKKQDTGKSYNEKEQKDIAEGLSKLKSDSSAGEGTLQSKMPSRTDEQEDISKKGIKIPTSSSLHSQVLESKIPSRTKKQEEDTKGIKIPTSSSLHGQALVYEREKIEAAEKTLQEQNKGLIENVFGKKESDTKVQIPRKGASNQQVKSDGSIFGGQSEVSRLKLEYKMKKDLNVWKAARDVKLNISPAERAKLVKEVFSSALGRNISKTDLQWSIKKLNQKMLDTKNLTEHAKIRKEIKFFKKVGGIK